MATASAFSTIMIAVQSAAIAALTKKAGQIAGNVTNSLVDSFISNLSSLGADLPTEQRSVIAELARENEGVLSSLLAHLRKADRKGMLLIGPSGSGKTELFNALTNRIPRERRSTIEVDDSFIKIGGKIRMIRDSMGQEDFLSDVFPLVRQYCPTTLVIVVADGHLDTRGTGEHLIRPVSEYYKNNPREFEDKDLESFLEVVRGEEVWWIERFTQFVARPPSGKRVRYIVLAVNKMDLWADKFDEVMKRYTTGHFAEVLEALATKVGIAAHRIQVVGVAPHPNGFKRMKPSLARFDDVASEDTVRIFKAFLGGLMYEGNL